MEGHDVDGPALRATRLESGPRQQPEAPGVVGKLAGGVAVEAVPAVRRRVVDEAEAMITRSAARGSGTRSTRVSTARSTGTGTER
jgi:hypothetical protein